MGAITASSLFEVKFYIQKSSACLPEIEDKHKYSSQFTFTFSSSHIKEGKKLKLILVMYFVKSMCLEFFILTRVDY